MSKERVLYTSFSYESYTDDDIREMLKECDKSLTDEDITEEMIWEKRILYEEMDWDDFCLNFRNELDNDMFVLHGSLGLWFGRRTGYKLIKSSDDFYRAISGYDGIRITENRHGRTFIELYHHDGTHYMELRRLTDKGKRMLENASIYISELELCSKLIETPSYTKNARIGENVYGKVPNSWWKDNQAA